MKKIKIKPGVFALFSSVIAAAWSVKFIVRYISRVQWDTVDWIINLGILLLWVIIAAEWIIKWCIQKKKKR